MATKVQLTDIEGNEINPVVEVDNIKDLSKIAPYTIYLTSGHSALIKCSKDTRFVEIKGICSHLNSEDFKSLVNLNISFLYNSGSDFLGKVKALSIGEYHKDIKVGYYNDEIYIGLQFPSWYAQIGVSCYEFVKTGAAKTSIISAQQAEWPEEVTKCITITPEQVATTGSGEALGVVDLPSSVTTLDLDTLPNIKDVGTLILRYNGVVKDLDTYIAPKQEGGIPVPQSEGINTLDLVNNAVPLANLDTYVGTPNNWLKIYVPYDCFIDYVDQYPTLRNRFHVINGDDDVYKYTYYNGTRGVLIKTNIKDTHESCGVEINIHGVCLYNKDKTPVDTTIGFMWEPNSPTLGHLNVINSGNKGIKVVKVFTYNGYVYLHIEKPGDYILFRVNGLLYNTGSGKKYIIHRNIIKEISNNEIPEGAENINIFTVKNNASTDKIVARTGDYLYAEINNYYRYDSEVNTLNITLSTIDSIDTETFTVFLTTGNTPNITIQSENNEKEISYMQGFSIEPNTTYELNFMFNGLKWIVAYGIIE